MLLKLSVINYTEEERKELEKQLGIANEALEEIGNAEK